MRKYSTEKRILKENRQKETFVHLIENFVHCGKTPARYIIRREPGCKPPQRPGGNFNERIFMLKVGLIGCGNISSIYLKNAPVFAKQIMVTSCADLRRESAENRASQYGIKACSVEEILADPEIAVILNHNSAVPR